MIFRGSENIFGQIKKCIKASGRMENNMEKVKLFSANLAVFTTAIGNKTDEMAKDSSRAFAILAFSVLSSSPAKNSKVCTAMTAGTGLAQAHISMAKR